MTLKERLAKAEQDHRTTRAEIAELQRKLQERTLALAGIEGAILTLRDQIKEAEPAKPIEKPLAAVPRNRAERRRA